METKPRLTQKQQNESRITTFGTPAAHINVRLLKPAKNYPVGAELTIHLQAGRQLDGAGVTGMGGEDFYKHVDTLADFDALFGYDVTERSKILRVFGVTEPVVRAKNTPKIK